MEGDCSVVVVRVDGIAADSAADTGAVADLLCSVGGVDKSDFSVSSVERIEGETATARISCSGADVAEALVQNIHGELMTNFSTIKNSCKFEANMTLLT